MSRRAKIAKVIADAVAAEMEALPSTSAGHNTLETTERDIDPVKGTLRFGMDSILKIVNETVPYIGTNDEKIMVVELMESYILQMLEAEMTYSQSASIVNDIVDELALQDNLDMGAEEFIAAVDSIDDIAHERLSDYQDTLTESILRTHPTFLKYKARLQSVMSGLGLLVDNADAETEAEEVDLEDSQADEDEEDNEVIPDLDPVTKQPLEDPVRNKVCRHIYGKAAMLQLIKKNPKTRCPAMGCDNATFVKASHLVEDAALTARVTGQPLPPKMLKTPAKGKAKRGRRRR